MQIEVESGIPAPTKPESIGRYPFDKLKVGNSFVVALDGRKSWGFIYAAINSAQRKHSIKLTTRLIDEENRRIWRVA